MIETGIPKGGQAPAFGTFRGMETRAGCRMPLKEGIRFGLFRSPVPLGAITFQPVRSVGFSHASLVCVLCLSGTIWSSGCGFCGHAGYNRLVRLGIRQKGSVRPRRASFEPAHAEGWRQSGAIAALAGGRARFSQGVPAWPYDGGRTLETAEDGIRAGYDLHDGGYGEQPFPPRHIPRELLCGACRNLLKAG